ncbi:MAG: pilus assembly protein [Pseudorhodobacter sp.]|nr:pilus assembly protein [Frankiaceae bacterium]
MRRRDEGSAVVDVVLVSVLVLALFLLVVQVGLVLHVRNVLVASAAEGARYGAAADRTADEAADRTRAAVTEAVGRRVADRMTYTATAVVRDGLPVVEVTVSGPLPVVLLPVSAASITVRGHALQEQR